MLFQNIETIDTADQYLDIAFSRAGKQASAIRGRTKGTRLQKSITIELVRIKTVTKELSGTLRRIIKTFPSFDDLHIFYQELIKLHFSIDELRKALSSLDWAAGKMQELQSYYSTKIKRCRFYFDVNKVRVEFSGRISSVMKKINRHLLFLENARKKIKDFPIVKTRLFTCSICGFPNVGKTTLLSKITKSQPEINVYPFTTKQINIGYVVSQGQKLQLLDTPGTLNRFDRMNTIEKQAFLAMKFLSDLIIYIFDLTESYPLKDQEKLFNKIKKDFDKPIMLYLSKTDILNKTKEGKEKIKRFKQEHPKTRIIDNKDKLINELIKKKKELL
ncbi:GTP-binding protein [Candidatus Woesearchaeota archaeon]|nr:GTP-binding protein [Candidatus Woesearchaeota archaeon]